MRNRNGNINVVVLLLLSIGALIGAVLGLTGAGGSVMAVPLLLIFLHLEPSSATGLALGVVAASSVYGAIQRIRHHEILWVPVLLFGLSGVVMAPFGRMLSAHVASHTLLISFAVLSLAITVRILWQSVRQPEQSAVVRAGEGSEITEALLCRFSETKAFDWRLRCIVGLTVGGIVTGLLSGFFGVGGGFMIVPLLGQINGVSIRHAVSTSLVIIAGISASGFVTYLLTNAVDWQPLIVLATGGVSGMVLGSVLARRIAGVYLQRIFAITIVVMTITMLIKG